MKIVSLDPGYDRCGLACIERIHSTDTLLDSMCVMTDKNESFESRLYVVGNTFRTWIQKHNPDACALETLFFAKNQKTAMRVAETRGALLFVAQELSIPIYEYTPKQVKVAVTGDGSASKKQVIIMVPKLISISKTITYDDEFDAIAVGLTASAVLSSTIHKQ